MHEEGREATSRTQAVPVCPVCGHPVGTTVKRHKTLGTFVPRWIPAPCSNPDCGQQAETREPSPRAGRRNTARGPGGAHKADTAP